MGASGRSCEMEIEAIESELKLSQERVRAPWDPLFQTATIAVPGLVAVAVVGNLDYDAPGHAS
jgi:hypothetical protein